MNKNPIGIFDSGIGGLTVAAGIAQQFPNESIIYFGDTAHLPYGEKSILSIQQYAKEISRFLIQKKCKLLVIACNSATAAAYQLLLKEFSQQIIIVDVILPLVEFVATQKFKKIGVIATKATISTNIYAKELQQKQSDLQVTSLATSLLVPMIEEGFLGNAISQATINSYLSYPDFQNIEALLLACTHYPLIRKEIEHYLGKNVKVFDSIDAVTKKITYIFEQNPPLRNIKENIPNYSFWVSDYTTTFEKTAQLFYGKTIKLKKAKWQNGLLVEDNQ